MDNNILITPEEIYNSKEINTYIMTGNDNLGQIGFTEHGFAHAKRCSLYASKILKTLDYPDRTCELAAIAGYMHDIGNTVNRADHAHSGALMAFDILNRMKMPPEEIAIICSAIGFHDEETAFPVSTVAAALIISDKSDVRRSRVRQMDLASDIHDRVNYAVKNSSLEIQKENKYCIFDIDIDTSICPVMEYFEIFIDRMILCRKSAVFLGLDFQLVINNSRLL
jgi:metal-dependent HD superfamily phosphatase/phosphodiesterase